MGYRRARLLLAGAGLGILAILLVVLAARGVDTAEVYGTLLFAPVFLALLAFGLPGGLVGAAVATAAYVALRADAIDAVGWGEFSGVVVSRTIAYFLFGGVGGWASGTLARSLDKLDLYDEVDDLTGCKNARFLLGDVDLERARAERYQTVFSLSFLTFDAAPVGALGAKRRRALLAEVGVKLRDGVRTVDRVAHGFDGTHHRIAVVLPETAAEGAGVFHDRAQIALAELLAARGVVATVTGRALTLPGDDEALAAELATWRAIDATEHDAAPI